MNKKKSILARTLLVLVCLLNSRAWCQNPIIRNQYSADPSARVFGGRVYLFPSHDILANDQRGRKGWFCMEDYHVFSSENLADWTDHGMIVSQEKVPWGRPGSYSMWAPDCLERNGVYHFYFPSLPKDTVTYGRGFAIGVAVAARPEGPYTPDSLPITGVKGIDPNVFIDKDGQAYLYWSQRNIYAARLKPTMRELDSEVFTLRNLPDSGLKEGPYLFERNGIYYLTYPHVEHRTERLEYAISDNPLGPFKQTGVIMAETPGCWTNHHSIIQFRNQWYLFYHANDYSPEFDKARSVRIDSIFFNEDGTIRQVMPTLRGVGLSNARMPLQVDRYSAKSPEGVSLQFIDTANRFLGWKLLLQQPGAWVQYNSIDAGRVSIRSVTIRARANTGGRFVLRLLGDPETLLSDIRLPAGEDWQEVVAPVKRWKGIQHLLLQLQEGGPVEVDWIRFN